MSQSSMLHIAKDSLINADAVEKALKMLHTTSPSLMLLASLDAARANLQSKSGQALLERTVENAKYLRKRLDKIERLHPYRYFGSPVGLTIWNDGERVVLMKMGELWGSNHDHLDTGCFQVYCGGALASDSGVYDSYHTAHRKNYTTRTSAHNCLTVFDPARPKYGEWREEAAYDGGTRRPCGGNEPKTLEAWRENYKMATVLEHTESEELCRILGDMTDAYSHTCDRVIREMTWEPKRGDFGVLTVRDEVESKSEEFITAFHLHCQREPKRIENGVILENDGFELVCRVKAPAQAKIEVIGGEGRDFEVDGVNYDTDAKAGTEAGWGQIVVTDPMASRHTQFLVEMELRKKENGTK